MGFFDRAVRVLLAILIALLLAFALFAVPNGIPFPRQDRSGSPSGQL